VRVFSPGVAEDVDFQKSGDGQWRSPELAVTGEGESRETAPDAQGKNGTTEP